MRRLIALISTGALVFALAGTALATPPAESGVVQRGPSLNEGFVYRDGGVIVLTGPDWELGCEVEGFGEADGLFVAPPSGSFQEHFTVEDEGILVFEDTAGPALDDIFVWIGENCEAALDEDPTTTPQEPIAEGEGKLSFHLRLSPDGVVHIHNGINGKVTTTDGRRVHVNTFAKLTDGPGGLDLQILRINYGG